MGAAAKSLRERSQYEHVCEIARGGMAEVSLVLRREGGFLRTYALKRLLPAYEGDPDVRNMFADEARIAGLLRHPNVVSVLDVGEDDQGVFLIMDYVEGLPLTALVRRVAEASEPIPVQVALRIAIQAAEGLHAAHELTAYDGSALHLVHRDVSPQNILVGFDGVVRVTDFGVAKALGRTSRTTTGVIKGKAGYMAPEMLRFEEPDRRADLFSLGVVLYELLAGKRLYRSDDLAAAARRILNEPVPDVALERPEVPDALSELMFRLLAKEPDLRPASAREVARSLSAIVDELAAEEGAIEIQDYMARSLDASELSHRRSLVDDVERGRVKTQPALSLRAARRPRGRSGVWVVVLAGGLLLIGTGLGVWLATMAREEPGGAGGPPRTPREEEDLPPAEAQIAAPPPASRAPEPAAEPEPAAPEVLAEGAGGPRATTEAAPDGAASADRAREADRAAERRAARRRARARRAPSISMATASDRAMTSPLPVIETY